MAGVDESLLNRAERPHDEGFNNGGPLTNLFPLISIFFMQYKSIRLTYE